MPYVVLLVIIKLVSEETFAKKNLYCGDRVPSITVRLHNTTLK